MKQYVSQMLEKINACIFIIQSSNHARDINNMLFLSLIYAHAYISFVNYKGSILKFILQGWGSQYQLSLVKCDKLCKLFQIRRVGDMHGETYSKIRRICVHYFTPQPLPPHPQRGWLLQERGRGVQRHIGNYDMSELSKGHICARRRQQNIARGYNLFG